ncbi:glycosyltransferase family protein [Neolewinella litorea]|uniref:Glycosyltransferase RgtA/B/C/D-like domain-containing protein n=1 Tax=Neolewinella litorea TaxID=2562452 RepID=A0A4S4NNN8_9BACT|nr:hypothetical protein [Neolewinella litorea]THH41614.1 hypothetical protein E4021_03195 [Neolewinella litorea]
MRPHPILGAIPPYPSRRAVLLSVTALGGMLWLINLGYNRPLFIDEANVARNLFDRSYAELFQPLDHAQYAPPLYLVLTKILGELFGYRELVLRLPAFAGGLLAVCALWRAGIHLRLGYFTAVPLLLLFVNPAALRYVTELKPYGLDLGVGAGLLVLGIVTSIATSRRQLIMWTIAGMVAPWLSLPAVFVLAAVGLRGLYHDRRWVFPIVAWLLSFGLLYFTVLRPSVGSGYLNSFHQDYFLPWPDTLAALEQFGRIGWGLMRLTFGVTAVALIWGALLLVVGWLPRPRHAWLLLPLGIVLVVSGLRYYSLIDRLMLFALPGLWLIAGLAAQRLWRKSSRVTRAGLVVLTLIALDGSHSLRYFRQPITFSDGAKLAEAAKEGAYRVHPLAEPVVDYYLRIHPVTSEKGQASVRKPYGVYGSGEEHWLYDVLTAPRPNQDLRRDSIGAAERGCRVDSEPLYRARILVIRCP